MRPLVDPKLAGVHPDLQRVVGRCWLNLGGSGFRVGEGLRTLVRQRQLVASGASQTMDSRHLTGHAVDLHATVGRAVRWDWPLYYLLADAMALAANQENVPLRWGGCWDRECGSWISGAEHESMDYVARRKAMGERAFLDGPHFELPRRAYPAR